MPFHPILKSFALAAPFVALTSCSPEGASEERVVTLYRNSVTDENMRIHIAIFDASEKEHYNRGNCEQARLLFQNQAGVKTRFWCEKGRFKK